MNIEYMHPDITYINNQESDTGWGGPLVEYVWSVFPLHISTSYCFVITTHCTFCLFLLVVVFYVFTHT
jgi:hypothetical protein